MPRSDVWWGEEGVPTKRLFTLQEALHCCDPDTLVRVALTQAPHGALPGASAAPKKAARRIRRALAAMQRLPVKRKDGAGCVLVPEERFVLHVRGAACVIERAVHMAVVPVARLEEALSAGPAGGAGFTAGGGLGGAGGVLGGRLSLAPWHESLAYRVWLGGPWCCRERYMALGSAFWALARYGLSYEDALARQAQEKARRAAGEGACAGGAAGAVPCPGERAVATASDVRRARAAHLGLLVPDWFEEDYRDALAARVCRLNDAARLDLERNLAEAARYVRAA